MMTAATASKAMESNYTFHGGTKALPWAAILQAIMTMLAGCTPKSAKRFATNHPVAFKAMLHHKLSDDGLVDDADVPTVVEAAHTTFANASVEDVTAVWHEVRS